jgi:hypothetical protein
VELPEVRQGSGFQRSPSLVSLHETFVYEDDDDTHGAPTIDANPDAMAVATSNTSADPLTSPASTPVGVAAIPPAVLSAEDSILFDGLFDMHPFAAAAFLRAFIACSFGLMMFHTHSLLTWPDDDNDDDDDAAIFSLGSVARKWLILQVGVLAVQVPLRMEVQRALFRVSTARDTPDAKRRLRLVFSSSAWRTNRKFGRATLLLMLLGPLVLYWSGCFFRSSTPGRSRLELQLLSVNASNLLVSMTRAVLVISLHYFIHVSFHATCNTSLMTSRGRVSRSGSLLLQVAAPPQPAQKRGLSEGTIRRLRRITFSASTVKHENELTQCAVCLEHYEEDDRLMVRPYFSSLF